MTTLTITDGTEGVASAGSGVQQRTHFITDMSITLEIFLSTKWHHEQSGLLFLFIFYYVVVN